jgi:hypothetical protein
MTEREQLEDGIAALESRCAVLAGFLGSVPWHRAIVAAWGAP